MITPTKPWPRRNCRHPKGLETFQVGIWPKKKWIAMCLICSLKSSSFDLKTDVKEDVWSKTLFAKLRDAGLKEPEQFVRIMEKPDHYGTGLGHLVGTQTATGAALHASTTADIPWPWDRLGVSAPTTVGHFKTQANDSLNLEFFNQTYKQLMETIVIQNQANQKPYWIIVSDEGHAKIPHKHFVKAEAEAEAQRLTETKPGITFTVFESKSSVFTPKADTKKTEYAESPVFKAVPWSYKYNFLNTRDPYPF